MTQSTLNYPASIAKTTLLDKLLLSAIYGVFLLLPWYHNYSGEIQPVDIVIAITATLFFVDKQFFALRAIAASKIYRILLFLLGYLVIRYLFAYSSDSSALYQVAANCYYAILTALFVHLFLYLYQSRTPQAFYEIILNCLLATIVIPFGILLFYGPNYGLDILKQLDPNVCRPALTFYNANQLGFFALINLAVFYYLTLFADTGKIKINKILSLALININLIFLVISVSRAASPGFILYFLSYPLIFQLQVIKKYPKTFWLSLVVLSMTWLGSIYIYHHIVLPKATANQAVNSGFLNDLYFRSFSGIFYTFSSVKLFLFGNGSLFNPSRTVHMEYHNNFTSLLNQTGIIGLLLYCYLIVEITRKLFKKGLLYVIPFMCYLIYSELHYAFRTRTNWLFFAVVIFILLVQERSSKVNTH